MFQLRAKIATLKRGSKQWWSLNRELLNKKAKISSIPPLRDGPNWLADPKEKANLFAKTFSDKAKLPAEAVDCPFFGIPDVELDDFLAIRSRYTLQLLKGLDVSKATGRDKLPAVILKRIAHLIAVPFTMICRRLLHEGCWPSMWKYHLIFPTHK